MCSQDNSIIQRKSFYNKFIQRVESGSVSSKIGSHIAEWVNNPEERLNKTIGKSLDSGLQRLEITYYTSKLPKIEDVEDDINLLKSILKHAPRDTYFYTPIAEQYKQYISCIKENLILIEPNLKILLFCRSL